MLPDGSGSIDDHDDDPVIEDATEPPRAESDPQVIESLADNDDDVRLDVAAREIPVSDDDASSDQVPPIVASGEPEEPEDAGDTDSIQEGPEDRLADDAAGGPREWHNETSAHKIAVELKRIETTVRELLDGRDNRRKRRLTGTRRWLELQDDLIAWRGNGRIDGPTLATLEQLIARRHYLFRRLHFLAGTRHGWNT